MVIYIVKDNSNSVVVFVVGLKSNKNILKKMIYKLTNSMNKFKIYKSFMVINSKQ